MRVLIACEFSGIVREAFKFKGHEAFSCDFLPTEIPSDHHVQGNVKYLLDNILEFDLMIAFPPCTHLAVSGARWFKDRLPQQTEALLFIKQLLECEIPRICLENPIGIISTHIRKPDQIIQPWMFGHSETKATCLWLKNLPKLVPTIPLKPPYNHSIHHEAPGYRRQLNRSRTFKGIAEAMAEQWNFQ